MLHAFALRQYSLLFNPKQEIITFMMDQDLQYPAIMKDSIKKQTIETLENNRWGPPQHNTHLVKRCHELRKIPIGEFTAEDLRIMIGQQMALPYLVPMAIEKLTRDLFTAGDFYEGDLLQNVLHVNSDFWRDHPGCWHEVDHLIKDRRAEISDHRIDGTIFEQNMPGIAQ